jgi:hypothetical protein
LTALRHAEKTRQRGKKPVPYLMRQTLAGMRRGDGKEMREGSDGLNPPRMVY